MASDNADWLALTQEEALEPDLPICDPHHHLWEARTGYVQPRYLLGDILEDLAGGHNVVSTVFIECGTMFRTQGPEDMRPVGETEFVTSIAAMSAAGGTARVAAGIVGTAYLDRGDSAAAVLDAQIEAGQGRFRGIRQGVTWHESAQVPNHRTAPPPGLYDSAGFRAGLAHLAPRGLTFELWCYHTQLDEAERLVRDFPDQTFILDHFGGPLGIGPYAGRADEVFADWCRAVAPVAACPNVMAKLGGLAMEVNGFGWHERPRPPTSQELMAASQRYYDTALELFGTDRCLFESNFPVEKVSCSYTVLWNAFKRLTASFSAAEKAALYHDNAAYLYRV